MKAILFSAIAASLTILFGSSLASPSQIALQRSKLDNNPEEKLPPLRNISTELFREFEELSRVVDISYCVGTSGIKEPFSCLSRCEDFPSFELVQQWNTGPFMTDSTGYIALSHPPAPKRILVVFRGTYSLANTIIDLSTVQQTYIPYAVPGAPEKKCDNCTVHTGFYDSWQDAKSVIGDKVEELMEKYGKEGYRLEMVGHSMGGAVAALAGLEYASRQWDPKITTFGEPRIGNRALASFVSEFFNSTTFRRISHTSDPVPHLPFDKWGFSPHDFEFFITKKGLTPEVGDVVECTAGPEDPRCISSEAINALELFSSHRDYFNRIGLCVPHDFFRLPWQRDSL